MERRPAVWSVCTVSLLMFSCGLAQAASETTAFASATVLPTGPRVGNNGKNYMNTQGRSSSPEGKYASFAVVDFHAPDASSKVDRIKGLTVTLVQSIPSFAHNGPVKFYITTDTKTPLEPTEPPAEPALKFDKAGSDGLGDQLQKRYPLGSGTFTKDATGHVDTFTLTLSDAAGAYLRDQLKRGGDIRLIIAPDSDDVAATYYGAGTAVASNRPKLTIDGAAAP